MQPTLQTIEAFNVAGLAIRTDNATEQSPQGKISALWHEFFSTNIAANIPQRAANTPIYGTYSGYESDYNGKFDVIAGVQLDPNTTIDHAALRTIHVPSGRYLVFQTHGTMPQRVIDGWQAVWRYFNDTNTAYQRAYTVDFEQYIDEQHAAIFIAVTE